MYIYVCVRSLVDPLELHVEEQGLVHDARAVEHEVERPIMCIYIYIYAHTHIHIYIYMYI